MSFTIENSPFSSFIQGNEKYITLKEHAAEQLIVSENIAEFINLLKKYFQVERIDNELIKLKVSDDVLKFLEKCLNMVNSNSFNFLPDDRNAAMTELYRCLRNCATNELSQNFICFETSILEMTKIFVSSIQKDHLCIKIILQFLINLITLNSTAVQKVHTEFFVFLTNLIKEGIHTYESSALIYNISKFIPLEINTVENMFRLYNETNENEFLVFFIENCLSINEFWNIYDKLRTSDKLIALESLRTQQIKDIHYQIPACGIKNIISGFLKSPDIFFKITNETVFEEVHEVSLLLEILSSTSSKEENIKTIQENKDVLITSAALLINFHRLGKTDNNLFTPIKKLSESGPEESNNPVFGLKADLIRLIGNICWKNTLMQNLAREAEVIPVILDCCNIDVKNPFIIQWCIFAIRNLCENNLENQNVISGLHQEGTVSSQVLDEFGITLDTDGENQLRIVPLDSLKK